MFCFAITPLCIAIPHCLLRTGDVRTDRRALLFKQLILFALQILWIFIPNSDVLLIPTAVSFSGFHPSAHCAVWRWTHALLLQRRKEHDAHPRKRRWITPADAGPAAAVAASFAARRKQFAKR